MAHATGGIQPTFLVLEASERESIALMPTDVLSMPEIQNAVAYFGEDTNSVRVRTQPDRRVALEEHVNELCERKPGAAFEFAGRRFDLEVVAG